MRVHDKIWWNGSIVPWDEARVHVTSDTAQRGLNVFEGLRAYWRPSSHDYAIIGLDAHLERLENSARLLSIPAGDVKARMLSGLRQLVGTIEQPSDLYLRPTLYIDAGAYDIDQANIVTGEFISWRPAAAIERRALRCSISSWLHTPAQCLPPHAKIGAAYTAFRLARLDVQARGFDEALLANADGDITETPGGAIFIVQDDQLVTPPLETGILPSITRRIVIETLAPLLGIRCKQRRLRRGDIVGATAALIVGTLDEISRITALDDHVFGSGLDGDMVSQLDVAYRNLCRNGAAGGWVSLFPGRERAQ